MSTVESTVELIHSSKYMLIHIHNRDLPQSFEVPRLIDNTTHTPVLIILWSHVQIHTHRLYF